jgi:hypothetical protein
MTNEQIENFIATNKWIFAKSYAKTTPHEYCLFKYTPNKTEFNDFVFYMKGNLTKERFFSVYFSYFYFGDYKYWTMEKPGEQAILINRAPKNKSYDNSN